MRPTQAEKTTPPVGAAPNKTVADWDGDKCNLNSSTPATHCKHCGTPAYKSTCTTCAGWLQVHAAHITMAKGLKGVDRVHR